MLKFPGFLIAAVLILSGCAGTEESQSTDELQEVTVKSEGDEILAETADFEKAEIRYEEDTGLMQLEMYMKDQQMMEEMFGERMGQEIHFYYGDELISSPNLLVPIEGESFTLAGDFDEETAEQIVEAIAQQAEEDQE
ncbi:hypothetical protein JMA_04550 [Jeotgalibacillus malaysiensis]|uniref:Preprotein translocase subunit SecD n=1 Tax=Jeotgalibacillus malaysiensis TaxID=1508404 RepID=A0A0B5AM69_9BACL|nr:hypothetical protein [Jeotgalibacillus malaysiensis]AJD89772.1 hypothetical protein JMA_04550 [Jeotgalibacillus malaysiensis]